MNNRERIHSDDRRRVGGFTIMELLVAMALLMILVAISGIVFRVAVNSYRAAVATSEILRKYRAIVDQLDADFAGLDKTGEIFIAWVPGIDTDGDDIVDEFNRSDRIIFFSTGATNYQSYNLWPELPELPELPPGGAAINDIQDVVISGKTARIGYMLAKDGNGTSPEGQEPRKRVLGRSQHVYTSKYICETVPPSLQQSFFPNPVILNDPTSRVPYLADFANLNNYYEYDTMTLTDWLNIPYTGTAGCPKSIILEQITDIGIVSGSQPGRGLKYDENNSRTHHLVLSQGVGQFAVQGWSDPLQRWVPEIDPNGDGDLSDTDFVSGPGGNGVRAGNVIGLLYPQKMYVMGPGVPDALKPMPQAGTPPTYPTLNPANFDNIPGLGRALKFTFTLYDSNKVFPEGKTFTHIVYLPD